MSRDYLIDILKKTLTGLVFLTPFVVLIVYNSLFFPYITSKAFVFRLLIEASFALWIILCVLEPSYFKRVWSSLLARFATLFLVIIFIADILGVNFLHSLWSTFERMEGFIALAHVWAYLIVFISIFVTEKIWNYFWHTHLGASVLVGLHGLFQLFGFIPTPQGTRLNSTLGNAAYLGTYMFFMSFITIFLWLRSEKSLKQNIIYGLILFLQVVVLYNTATRGALLGFVASIGLVLLGLAFTKGVDQKFKKISLSLIVVGVILFGGFWFARDTDFVQNSNTLGRFADLSLTERTTVSRLTIWSMALDGVAEKPIFGWGQENFIHVFSKYYDPSMYNQEPWFDRTHNIFLDWLIVGGLLGLLSYLSLYLSAIWLVVKKMKEGVYEKILLLSLLGGYMFQNLFIFDNLTSYILFFGLLGYIGSRSIADIDLKDRREIKETSKSFYIISVLVVLVFSFVFYSVNVKPYMAAKSIIDSLKHANDPVFVATNFKESVEKSPMGRGEILTQAHALTHNILSSSSVDGEFKKSWLTWLDSQFQDLLKQNADARSFYIYTVFLFQNGQIDRALELADQTIDKSPEKQQLKVLKASILIHQKRYREVKELMEPIYEEFPLYEGGAIIYASALSYLGEEKKYQEVVSGLENKEWGVVNDDRFTEIYKDRNEYSKLVSFWQMRKTFYPDDLNVRLRLAGSLYGNREYKESVDVLMQAKLDFPSQSSLLDDYITGVQSRTIQISN